MLQMSKAFRSIGCARRQRYSSCSGASGSSPQSWVAQRRALTLLAIRMAIGGSQSSRGRAGQIVLSVIHKKMPGA
jgi:hypothetical protein